MDISRNPFFFLTFFVGFFSFWINKMRDHQTPTVFSLLKQQTPSQEAIEEYFLLFLFFFWKKGKDNTEIIKVVPSLSKFDKFFYYFFRLFIWIFISFWSHAVFSLFFHLWSLFFKLKCFWILECVCFSTKFTRLQHNHCNRFMNVLHPALSTESKWRFGTTVVNTCSFHL